VFKKIALASTALTLLAGAASAADLPRRAAPVIPVAPVFTWAGFYIGDHTGVIFNETRIRTRGNAANTIANVAGNRRPASIRLDDDWSFSTGIQAGYNFQFGNFVFGPEADIAYTRGVKDREIFVSALGDVSVFRQEMDFFGTIRGRVGFTATPTFLIYATGGLAYAGLENRVGFLRNTDQAFQFLAKKDEVAVGYAVGGGIEFQLPAQLSFLNFVGPIIGARNVSVKAEYLYYDLGSTSLLVDAVPGVGVNSYTSRFDTTGHLGKIGLNYRFGT
jgi:outer membrane immunogenic protein